MEVTLVNRLVYDLPSKQRVGCIAYDGAADMQLWPGPGPDSELRERYGDELQRSLDRELRTVEGRMLEIPSVIRVHRGRLHCNFLAWIATRPAELGTKREPAPPAEVLREGVMTTLRFCAERNVERVAFPALGGGPDEIDRAERLALIVKTAHAYHEECIAAGRAPVVEEVLVCEALLSVFRKAQQQVRGLARAAERAPTKAIPSVGRGRARSASSGSSSRARSTSSTKSKSGKATSRAAGRLTAAEIASARGSVERYSMRATYEEGQYFIHPKFGVGRVITLTGPGKMLCTFEDGTERQLVFGRA